MRTEPVEQNQVIPASFMMLAVLCYSIVPLLFKLGDAEGAPILFTGIQQLSMGIVVGITILTFNWKLLVRKSVRKNIAYQCRTSLMLISIIGHGGWVLFAIALSFVDISVAAILFETRPLLLMLLISFLFRNDPRYRPLTTGTMIFVVMALAGVCLVVASHNEAPLHLLLKQEAGVISYATLLGGVLVLVSAFCGATSPAFSLKMGAELAKRHADYEGQKRAEFIFVVALTSIGQIIAGVVLCLVGFAVSESVSMHQVAYSGFTGVFVTSLGITAIRVANMTTNNLGVNALAYITPLVALAWLWSLSLVNVTHFDYLVIGAMGIVAANMLINAKADKRTAYGALVVSLWIFGTITYFTDGYVTDVPLELPVTIFILVMAFRVDRLVRRTSQEEGWVFEIYRKIEYLSSRKVIDCKALEALMKIDRHQTLGELKRAYGRLEGFLAHPVSRSRIDAGTEDKILQVRHLVDSLAHSRQQGSHFGEFVAIAMAGGLIAAGLLFFNGGRDFYSEITSLLLPSIVVFLFFNILDLQKDRKDRILTRGAAVRGGRYIVKFDDTVNRKGQQWISVAASTLIVVVFAVLFR